MRIVRVLQVYNPIGKKYLSSDSYPHFVLSFRSLFLVCLFPLSPKPLLRRTRSKPNLCSFYSSNLETTLQLHLDIRASSNERWKKHCRKALSRPCYGFSLHCPLRHCWKSSSWGWTNLLMHNCLVAPDEDILVVLWAIQDSSAQVTSSYIPELIQMAKHFSLCQSSDRFRIKKTQCSTYCCFSRKTDDDNTHRCPLHTPL